MSPLSCKLIAIVLIGQMLGQCFAQSSETKDLMERLKVPPRFGKRNDVVNYIKDPYRSFVKEDSPASMDRLSSSYLPNLFSNILRVSPPPSRISYLDENLLCKMIEHKFLGFDQCWEVVSSKQNA